MEESAFTTINLFDSHCHLEDERFNEDRDQVMARMAENGVRRCILAGSDLPTSQRIVDLTRQHENVYGVVGFHPHEAKFWTDECEARLTRWQQEKRIVGIGEIGLDYYYDLSPRDVQQQVFEKQLLLARRLGVPVVFHIRDAHGDVLDILRAHRQELPAGVVHCYSGSVESAREYLDMGFYLSFAGPVTFKNARKLLDVARFVPGDRLLVETDSPYLAPVPMRGKRNEPAYVRYVAQTVAQLRGVSLEELAAAATRNTCRLYGIEMEQPMTIRKTTEADLPAVMALYAQARGFMRQNGNAEQWTAGYPSQELVLQDIALARSYVCQENGQILAVFVLVPGDDPTYAVIDGAWKNNRPYGTLHRVASSGQRRGMMDEIVRWAFQQIPNLRGDTHADNLPMQRAFLRNGFQECGVIHLEDGSPRIAYQKEY